MTQRVGGDGRPRWPARRFSVEVCGGACGALTDCCEDTRADISRGPLFVVQHENDERGDAPYDCGDDQLLPCVGYPLVAAVGLHLVFHLLT